MSLTLFPLHSLLIPGQLLSLKVFEPRYLDCLKRVDRFGVVLIREGSEVVRTSADIPQLFNVGVEACIVDYVSAESGLVLQLQGQRKFQLCQTHLYSDNLLSANIDWLPEEPALDVPAHCEGLFELLEQLRLHPQAAELQLEPVLDARQLGWQLCLLLPLSNPVRVELLGLTDPIERLERILPLVEELAEGR